MKKIPLRFGLALTLFSALFLTSCLKDQCDATLTYMVYEPVFAKPEVFRQPIKTEAARELKAPGRIYVYKDYLFINEDRQGIHIFDNKNPSEPVSIGFMNIPGNVNMAVRNDILYADNYIDLVSIDISDPTQPKYLDRTENVFFDYGFYAEYGYLISYEPTEKTIEVPCGNPNSGREFFWYKSDVAQFDILAVTNTASGSQGAEAVLDQAGVGGSMARFTITANHLYTLRDWELKIFSLQQPSKAALANTLQLGWGMETIFPYGDKLFFGANNGMHIYSISDPANPQHLSTFEHARACDPVFIDGNLAYVTLRDGSDCQNFNNQLDVVDITSLTNPRLLATYGMKNPHGLSKVNDNLFICEGEHGLKVFDASEWDKIGQRQLSHLEGFATFDIIALAAKQIAIVIGKDGLYQFDISDPADLRQLSVIRVQR